MSLFDRYVLQGGIMMIFLIPCLVLMIAFVVQALINLRRSRVAPAGFGETLRKLRKERGLEGAREYLRDSDHSLGEVIRNVDAHLDFKKDADPAEVLREQIADECDLLMQQNSQLAVIFRVAPQLGLLGTVFGMIDTFNKFATSTNPDVQELSVGINVALITTAWGLAIAIPAYIAYYLIVRRVSTYEQVILPQEGIDALHAILDRPVRGTSATSQQKIERPAMGDVT